MLYSQLLVRRVRPNAAMLLAQNSILSKGILAPYILTRVEIKTFTFSAVLGHIPKLVLFTMVKNIDYFGSLDSISTSAIFRCL